MRGRGELGMYNARKGVGEGLRGGGRANGISVIMRGGEGGQDPPTDPPTHSRHLAVAFAREIIITPACMRPACVLAAERAVRLDKTKY